MIARHRERIAEATLPKKRRLAAAPRLTTDWTNDLRFVDRPPTLDECLRANWQLCRQLLRGGLSRETAEAAAQILKTNITVLTQLAGREPSATAEAHVILLPATSPTSDEWVGRWKHLRAGGDGTPEETRPLIADVQRAIADADAADRRAKREAAAEAERRAALIADWPALTRAEQDDLLAASPETVADEVAARHSLPPDHIRNQWRRAQARKGTNHAAVPDVAPGA